MRVIVAVLVWALLFGLAPPGRADDAYGSLEACTSTVTPCRATITSNISDLAVSYHVAAGTAAVTLQGQVRDSGDAWQDLQALTTDTVVRLTGVRFFALRAKPTACTGCAYTLTFAGFPRH